MIFVCAHGDLFHESVPYEWIDQVWGVMSLAPRHTFQVLTKRADRMHEIVPRLAARHRPPDGSRWPLPNVWLGVSVEDQRRANERIPLLLRTPAAVRWLSCEPLLGDVTVFSIDGPVDIHPGQQSPLHWIVAGGESGPRARAMHPEWARSLRDQCAAAGVPFHFKQWGGIRPDSGGCELDGVEIQEWPAERN